MLVEGSSLRSISRVIDTAVNTIVKLQADAGRACVAFHDEHVRDVLWTPQNRPFPAPETGVDLYLTASFVRKVVWTLVRQLRGPHFSTCA